MPSPFECAETGNLMLLEMMYGRGAPLGMTDCDGTSLLICAVRGDQLPVARWLLRNDVDASHAMHADTGNTALHVAAALGRLEMVRLLAGRGHLAAARNDLGESPAFLAAVNGHAPCLRVLAHWGAAVGAARTSDGASPAVEAARRGHAEVLSVFAEFAPLALQMPDAHGMTALVAAAGAGDVASVRALVTDGRAPIDAAVPVSGLPLLARLSRFDKASAQATPLMAAAAAGHGSVAVELIRLGADITISSGPGHRHAAAIATAMGHVGCVQRIADAAVEVARLSAAASPPLAADDEAILSPVAEKVTATAAAAVVRPIGCTRDVVAEDPPAPKNHHDQPTSSTTPSSPTTATSRG